MAEANLAVLPGSLLPVRALCQQLADGLPAGAVLIVLPEEGPQRTALETVALVLAAQGRQVTTLPAATVRTAQGQLALPLLA